MSASRTKGHTSLSVPVQPLSPAELCEVTPIWERSKSISPSQAAESFQRFRPRNSDASDGSGLISLVPSHAVPGASPLANPPAAAYSSRRSRTSSLTPLPADLAECNSAFLSQHSHSGNPSRHHVPESRRGSLAVFAPWASAGFAQLPHLGDEGGAPFLASSAVTPTSRRSSCSYSDSLALQRRARNDASPVALGNPSVIRHLAKRRERRMSEAARSRRSSTASGLASFSQEMLLRSPRESGRTMSRSTRYSSLDPSAIAARAAVEASRRYSAPTEEVHPPTDDAAEAFLSGGGVPLALHSEEEEMILYTKAGAKKVRRMTQEALLPASVASSFYRGGAIDQPRREAAPSAGPRLAAETPINAILEADPLFVDASNGSASPLPLERGVRSHRGSTVTEMPKAGGGNTVAAAEVVAAMRSPPTPPAEGVPSCVKDQKIGKLRRFFSFLSPTGRAHGNRNASIVDSPESTPSTAVSTPAQPDVLTPATDLTTPTTESPYLSAEDTKRSMPEQVSSFGGRATSPRLLDDGAMTRRQPETPEGNGNDQSASCSLLMGTQAPTHF
ncbi:hypothetical protein LSCM1_01514 [Leishmania martiniquensis]|uniref:Uncharacterized protein n=1 Tax=Leishmania martiniquensis TaxID=1580590 RepID=A0A836KEW6_9TRYP|nr:hypothetical protein LSCM1_01514 [Leishmania martiniquensis]